jgi:hypothetical protein
MSLYNYSKVKPTLEADPPFYTLIMAAMDRADTFNLAKLRQVFPEIYEEYEARHNAPRGLLPGERDAEGYQRREDGALLGPDGEVLREADGSFV